MPSQSQIATLDKQITKAEKELASIDARVERARTTIATADAVREELLERVRYLSSIRARRIAVLGGEPVAAADGETPVLNTEQEAPAEIVSVDDPRLTSAV